MAATMGGPARLLALLLAALALLAPGASRAHILAPAVTGPPVITSRPQGDAGAYVAGEAIVVRVFFNMPVEVRGDPTLTIRVGDADRRAAYVPMTADSAEAIDFQYVVVGGDNDADGVSIPVPEGGGSSIDVTSQSAIDAKEIIGLGGPNGECYGYCAANLDHAPVADDPAQRVDTAVPTVVGAPAFVTTPLATDGSGYAVGEKIGVRFAFSEPMRVTGIPSVQLRVGAAIRRAYFARINDRTDLVFEYACAANDEDADGVEVLPDSMVNGPTTSITDLAGTPASLAHQGLGNAPGQVVRPVWVSQNVDAPAGGPTWRSTVDTIRCGDTDWSAVVQNAAWVEIFDGRTLGSGGEETALDPCATSTGSAVPIVGDSTVFQVSFGEPLSAAQQEALRAGAADILSSSGMAFRLAGAARRSLLGATDPDGTPRDAVTSATVLVEGYVIDGATGVVSVGAGDTLRAVVGDSGAAGVSNSLSLSVDRSAPVPVVTADKSLLFQCDDGLTVSVDFGEPMLATRAQMEAHVSAVNGTAELTAWDRSTGTGQVTVTAAKQGEVRVVIAPTVDGSSITDLYGNVAAGAEAVALCEKRPFWQENIETIVGTTAGSTAAATVATATATSVASSALSSTGASAATSAAGAAGGGSGGGAGAGGLGGVVAMLGALMRISALELAMPSWTSSVPAGISQSLGDIFLFRWDPPDSVLHYTLVELNLSDPAPEDTTPKWPWARRALAAEPWAVGPWNDPSAAEADWALHAANAAARSRRAGAARGRGLAEDAEVASAEKADPAWYEWDEGLSETARGKIQECFRQLFLVGAALAALTLFHLLLLWVRSWFRGLRSRGLPTLLDFPNLEAFALTMMLPVVAEAGGTLLGFRTQAGLVPVLVGAGALALVVFPVCVLVVANVLWCQAVTYPEERQAYYEVPLTLHLGTPADAVQYPAWRRYLARAVAWTGLGRGVWERQWSVPLGVWKVARGVAEDPAAAPRFHRRARWTIRPFVWMFDMSVGPPVVRVNATYDLIPGTGRFNRGVLVPLAITSWVPLEHREEKPRARPGAAAKRVAPAGPDLEAGGAPGGPAGGMPAEGPGKGSPGAKVAPEPARGWGSADGGASAPGADDVVPADGAGPVAESAAAAAVRRVESSPTGLRRGEFVLPEPGECDAPDPLAAPELGLTEDEQARALRRWVRTQYLPLITLATNVTVALAIIVAMGVAGVAQEGALARKVILFAIAAGQLLCVVPTTLLIPYGGWLDQATDVFSGVAELGSFVTLAALNEEPPAVTDGLSDAAQQLEQLKWGQQWSGVLTFFMIVVVGVHVIAQALGVVSQAVDLMENVGIPVMYSAWLGLLALLRKRGRQEAATAAAKRARDVGVKARERKEREAAEAAAGEAAEAAAGEAAEAAAGEAGAGDGGEGGAGDGGAPAAGADEVVPAEGAGPVAESGDAGAPPAPAGPVAEVRAHVLTRKYANRWLGRALGRSLPGWHRHCRLGPAEAARLHLFRLATAVSLQDRRLGVDGELLEGWRLWKVGYVARVARLAEEAGATVEQRHRALVAGQTGDPAAIEGLLREEAGEGGGDEEEGGAAAADPRPPFPPPSASRRPPRKRPSFKARGDGAEGEDEGEGEAKAYKEWHAEAEAEAAEVERKKKIEMERMLPKKSKPAGPPRRAVGGWGTGDRDGKGAMAAAMAAARAAAGKG